ncbi:MAG: hypothetical protein EOO68_22920, partial [Moraxellaceae bacterium]
MPNPKNPPTSVSGAGSILNTVSGPSTSTPPSDIGINSPIADQLLEKNAGAQALSSKTTFNENKVHEYG